jgi:LPXTG-site transpeptidase (sortase) family protein
MEVGWGEVGSAWDLTWLGSGVGCLEGTAFPTWPGNTALTAHVYDASGQPGPFLALNSLTWGDEVVIRIGGMRYVYAVRSNSWYTDPNDARSVTKHEDLDWVTLITCRGYDQASETYRWRNVVRAVLVDVRPAQ